ncbi:MAG: HEAT repeat domain-containing protein [Candidatus Freyrarchaeum guaymaensis]
MTSLSIKGFFTVKDFIPSGLTNLLKSEKPETRKFAAYALGRIGDRKALPALARVADNPEEPKLVREVAGRAMQRLNPEKAEACGSSKRMKLRRLTRLFLR